MTPRFHSLRIACAQRDTADAVVLSFDVPAALAAEYRFVQGQHLTLRACVDGEEMRRSYSICSGADDGVLQVAIKKVAGGRFSAWSIDHLAGGDAIDVMTPEGRFHVALDANNAKHYVAFAAGSGITPVISLIRTTLEREPRSRFTLVYGNRRQSTVMFHEALQDLKDRHLTRFALYHVFSREPQDVRLFNGRLDGVRTREFLDALIPAASIDEAFVCGPASMIDEVESALLAAGIAREHVHVERFGTPAASAPSSPEPQPDAADAQLSLVIDGVRRDLDFHREHESILTAGLAAGLDLPFSCKGGMCCTCRARLIEGEVKMRRNFALDARDVDAGFVLTCQSYPLTGRVVVSYDDR